MFRRKFLTTMALGFFATGFISLPKKIELATIYPSVELPRNYGQPFQPSDCSIERLAGKLIAYR